MAWSLTYRHWGRAAFGASRSNAMLGPLGSARRDHRYEEQAGEPALLA